MSGGDHSRKISVSHKNVAARLTRKRPAENTNELDIYIYIYIYMYMCVCVCVCVCGTDPGAARGRIEEEVGGGPLEEERLRLEGRVRQRLPGKESSL